jgi:pyridoxal phosphate-dependent aminotransferase EpsN
MPEKRIYLSAPHMGGQELALVREAFDENWIAPAGPHLERFESEICRYTGAGHAVALSSGTAALHISLVLAGIGPGDEVLCSSFSFIASATPIVYQGATPVFVESEARSWNMDPDLLEEAVRDRRRQGKSPKAVVAVHLYGQSADIGRISDICSNYDMVLIEDAAESLGAYYGDRHTGTMGRFGLVSFNGNKIITASSGGMLLTETAELADAARHLSTQARDPAPHYQHSRLGYNYRLSNVLAAIGRGQLRVIEDRVNVRRRNFEVYRKGLSGLPGLEFMPVDCHGRGNHWLTCIIIEPEDFGADRETVRLALEEENIESRPLWKPLHLQPVFEGCEYYGSGLSGSLFERGLCLPSSSSMTDEDLDRVIRAVGSCASRQ